MRKRERNKRSIILNSDLDANSKFQIVESYKVARTNIMFSLMKKGCKKVIISSSLSGEGKTTTAVHTAISLAQMNLKVLLIDADLRKPKVNQFFNIDNAPGLTNFLGELNELNEIIHNTEYSNLFIMCAGIIVPNPSELLACSRMNTLIRDLEEQYDYIIIDTPPLNMVSDAIPLIKLSDGVILIIREGSSTYPELDKTIKGLKLIDASILGFILNGVQIKKKGSYRYRYEKYGDYNVYNNS